MKKRMTHTRYLFVILFLFVLLAGAPVTLLAQGGGDNPGGGINPQESVNLPNPLGGTSTIDQLLRRIVDWLIRVGAPVAAIMIIYGAFQMLFAGGDPEKFNVGKRAILYAAVGYGIIFIGWGIVSIIEAILTTNP